MPQDLADLSKGGSTAKHLRCRGVPQKMSACAARLKSRSSNGSPYHLAD
jgi:hypothetical protein